ncbi:hypothetical protein MB27_29790 [Actinoplanes utahensis]|uniref:HTH cro/C1-type domain-containing protein n=1 Tax=Actinoplanes utahensis TaxID=1869 RepID=A0A0A6X2E4_ACTUT|nr:hypothetical protein MB27_29790 [Actinoplanes utahensis]
MPRRTLGIALRKARENAKVTMAEAAGVIGQTVQSLRRIERGTVSTPKGKVTLLCMRYGVPDSTRAVLEELAGETRSKGWWHSYGDAVPTWFELYVALEQTADRLRTFEPWLIPGLLQDAAYMETAILAVDPDLTPEQLAARVEVRRSRQRQLTRASPQPSRLEVIIAESALRVALPEGVMRSQLRHLLRVAGLSNVSVRVLPLSVGLHRASQISGFVLLDFPLENGHRPPSTIYLESQIQGMYLDRPQDLNRYRQVWKGLDATALDQSRSAALMSRRLKELSDSEC